MNLVVVPGTGSGGGGGSSSSGRSRVWGNGRGWRGDSTVLGMVEGAGSNEQQGGGEAGGGELDGFIPEYGMPREAAIELVRLDMPEVPVSGESRIIQQMQQYTRTPCQWCRR